MGEDTEETICESCSDLGDSWFIGYSDVHGDDADEIDQIPELERKLRNFNAYLTSFTSGDANTVVRISGDSQELDVETPQCFKSLECARNVFACCPFVVFPSSS